MPESADAETGLAVAEESRLAVAQFSALLGYCGEVAERFERAALARGSWRRPESEHLARHPRPAIEVSGLRKTYPGASVEAGAPASE